MNQALKEYREKIQLGLISEPKKLDPIEKAEQHPNSLKFAIRAKCFDCSGFIKKDVTDCDMPGCELFNVRPWQRPNIKTQVDGVGVLLSEKPVIRKNSLSDSKNPQHKLNSEERLLPPYAKLKANPKSLRAAINAYCFGCCCEQRLEVKLCTAVGCPLHNLRPWQASKIY
jgi:hypothetical protein